MSAKRIVIADDEPHISRVMSLFLGREGYEVEVVRGGDAALEAIERKVPDVLITDINMPGMGGRELCLELEKRMPERAFKIIVMTSMTNREHREWSQDLRDTTFLEKPVSMRAIVSILAKHFNRSSSAAEPGSG